MVVPPVSDSNRARRWLAAGPFDLEFYSALRGLDFGDDELHAAEDFVAGGMERLLSPHPFLDVASLPVPVRRAWRHGRVGKVLEALSEDPDRPGRGRTPVAGEPTAARRALLVLAARLGAEARDGVPRPAAPVGAAPSSGSPIGGRLSVVVVAAEPRPTVRAVRSVLGAGENLDLEVVVLDRGSAPHEALALEAAFVGQESVEVVRVAQALTAVRAVDLALPRISGEHVLLLDPRVVLRAGGLAPMLAPLEHPEVAGVQPVLLAADDTVWSAGLVVAEEGGAPARLLAGHPAEDARRLAGQRLGAISAEAMALRTEDVVAVGGVAADLEPEVAALDLCARLLQRRPGGFRVAAAARATVVGAADAAEPLPAGPGIPADPGLLERIGFVVDSSRAQVGGTQPAVVGRRPDRPGQLRWSIKLPSPPGRPGDLWGDTHFADALADGLRSLGDDAVTARRGAHATGPTSLDDVALGLRGLYPVAPLPGQVNVLWVISHPDEVDPGELEGFDLVLAASGPWSAEMSRRSGRDVVPLLQATSFQPPPGPVEPEGTVVFVGTARNDRERPLVQLALDAGVPLAVYGPGWEGRLPPGVWRGEYVPNDRLPELYARHGIVLADHWPDMARAGFIANRVFDAVAAGARVISDDVVGMHEVFDPREVAVARSAADVARAVEEFRMGAGDAEGVRRPSLTFVNRARTLRELVGRL